jgi:hypothetical protein
VHLCDNDRSGAVKFIRKINDCFSTQNQFESMNWKQAKQDATVEADAGQALKLLRILRNKLCKPLKTMSI